MSELSITFEAVAVGFSFLLRCFRVSIMHASLVLACLIAAAFGESLPWPAPADSTVSYAAQQNPRAAVQIAPKGPFRPMPKSALRTKECAVKSNGGTKDDSQNILEAIKSCNNGGRVVFGKGSKYMIGTALDLRQLKSIDLGT
jgi:galacturan 1,4-alpha-galacturonidase